MGADYFAVVFVLVLVVLFAGFMRWVAWDFARDRRSRLLRQAGEGDAQALYELGLELYQGESRRQSRKAVECFRRAADAGLAEALAMLGECYASGVGVERCAARAVQCWKQAAGRGCVLAMGFLADYYAEGEAADAALMAHYCHAAARKGDLDACCRLGLCYLHGKGVKPSRGRAIAWLRYAAERQHAEASRLLREMQVPFCGDEP